MAERLTQILRDRFPDIDVNIEQLPSGRFSGNVVWDGFDGIDDVARQQEIRSVLKEKLGPEVQNVGVLLTYTHGELAAMHAA